MFYFAFRGFGLVTPLWVSVVLKEVTVGNIKLFVFIQCYGGHFDMTYSSLTPFPIEQEYLCVERTFCIMYWNYWDCFATD